MAWSIKDLFASKSAAASVSKSSFSDLLVDLHSHLIPGIDDGAKTMEESLELVRTLSSLGYRKLITTPHIMHDMYRNTPESILSGLEALRKELENEGIDMAIEAASIDEAKAEEARQQAEKRLHQKLSDEEAATVSATLSKSLAQLNVKRRMHGR